MRELAEIYATAVLHKGSVEAVELNLPECLSVEALVAQSDAYYLSEMSRRIFRAGLKHAMVDAKWPAFTRVFHGFDPQRVAMMSDDDIDALMGDESIIRHLGKLRAVRANAGWMLEINSRHGSFGRWLADWPADNIVELWRVLKKQGAQLGGQSGPRFLRMVGKDTFILTDDVVAVLKAEGVVTKLPTAKKDLQRVQAVFNEWAKESGRPLCQISRIVSYTADVH